MEELGMEVGTGETEGMEMIATGVATLVTTRSVSMVKKHEPTLGYWKEDGSVIDDKSAVDITIDDLIFNESEEDITIDDLNVLEEEAIVST